MCAPDFEVNGLQPVRLSADEIKDPNLAILRFFDYADLPLLRQFLWDWMKTTVAGTFSSNMLNKDQRYDMLYLYEQLEKLVEAAYLIQLRRSSRKTRKKRKK